MTITNEKGEPLMQAIGKNILLKPLMLDTKSKVLVSTIQKPYAYEVVSIGSSVTLVKVSDVVLIQQYGIQEKDYKGEKFYLSSEEHVYAKEMK